MKINQIKKINRSVKILPDKPSAGCCGDGTDTEKAPCCGPRMVLSGGVITDKVPGFLSWLDTPAGKVPQIATSLAYSDRLGACMARWGINRGSYIIPPGLYAIGTPDMDAPVIVTANYKMSYDLIRSTLSGRNVWLLVLETFGVNVWCAAGKGTLGTNELVKRINAGRLDRVVNHRQLLLPILGATGVSAHEVTGRTGFAVRYATIRASDLPVFLDNGMVSTPEMRRISFTTCDRLVLVPVELVNSLKSTAFIGGSVFLAALLASGYSAAVLMFAAYLGAVLTGVALVPITLPWIPGRSFAIKGALAGVVWCAALYFYADGSSWNRTTTAAALLALPSVCAFYALNFTGCTTYTSRSGVKKEMRLGFPVMGSAVIVAVLLLIAGRFL